MVASRTEKKTTTPRSRKKKTEDKEPAAQAAGNGAPTAPTAPSPPDLAVVEGGAEQAKGGNGKGGARVEAKGNQSDGTEFVLRIENVQVDIDEIMRKAREACSPLREDIKAIKDAAVDAGHKKSIINAQVRKRKFERKAKACDEGLDEVDTTAFEQLGLALDQSDMRAGVPG